MTDFPSIEYLERTKKYNMSFCDCTQCGSFKICTNNDGLCIDCWEIFNTYWWLVSPLESLSVFPELDASTLLSKES